MATKTSNKIEIRTVSKRITIASINKALQVQAPEVKFRIFGRNHKVWIGDPKKGTVIKELPFKTLREGGSIKKYVALAKSAVKSKQN